MSRQPLADAIVAPNRELLRGTMIAVVAAAVVLTVAVLPAEYGIDPTGAGKAMGLTRLSAAPAVPAAREPVNTKEDEFESFILEDGVSASKGTLIAPFTGVHGWYWKNSTGAPLTVLLRASGFYTGIYKK